MKDYKIFEIPKGKMTNELSYLFGPNGLNDDVNLSYKKIFLWRFISEDLEINLIQQNENCVCSFGKCDELVSFLLSKDIQTKTFSIESISGSFKNKFQLDKNHSFEIVGGGGWACSFLLKDELGKIIFSLGGPSHKSPSNVFQMPVKKVFDEKVNKKSPPEIIEKYFNNLKLNGIQEKTTNGCMKTIVFILTAVIIISIIALIFN